MTEVRRFTARHGDENLAYERSWGEFVLATDYDALADRVQAVEREIASQEVQMNAVRYRAEQAERKLAAMTAERDEWQNSCEQSRDLVACLRAELAASQARVKKAEDEARKWQRIRTPTHGNCCTCQKCGIDHDACRCDLDEMADEIAHLQATLAEREARTKELEEWQKIVIGSGTDQETVIRMAANEYTKSAVQCWKEHTKKIEAERDTARQDAARLRGILQAILNADERGQGLPFQEAMQEAQRALKGA